MCSSSDTFGTQATVVGQEFPPRAAGVETPGLSTYTQPTATPVNLHRVTVRYLLPRTHHLEFPLFGCDRRTLPNTSNDPETACPLRCKYPKEVRQAALFGFSGHDQPHTREGPPTGWLVRHRLPVLRDLLTLSRYCLRHVQSAGRVLFQKIGNLLDLA